MQGGLVKLYGICLLGLLLMTSRAVAGDTAALGTHREKSSYALGVNLIGNVRQQGVDIDLELVVKGMKDAFSGGKLLMSEEEVRKYISLYQNEVRVKQAKSRTAAAEANKKAGAAFLAENARKEGVVTLPSGLQYRVLKAGEGKKPTDTDRVECNYRGTTIQGTEFYSSHRTGKPATFKVKGGAIPGLSEALKLMQVGAKWQIFIPSKLAYGEGGSGNVVGPNEVVVFEVELVAIK